MSAFCGGWGRTGKEAFKLRCGIIGSVLSKLVAHISSINICQIDFLKGNGTEAKNSPEYNYSALGWEHFRARCG